MSDSGASRANSVRPPRKRWVRRFVIVAIVLTVIVLALLVPAVIDEAPVDDTDLIPAPVTLPAPELNMAVGLKTLEPDADVQGWDFRLFDFDLYASTAEERALIDWALIETALRANESYFAEIDRLIELPHCEFGPLELVDDPMPEFLALRSMFDWIEFRQVWRCEQGAVRPAVDLALRWADATNRARTHCPNVIAFLATMSFSLGAVEQATRISFAEEATAADLDRLSRVFDAPWPLYADYIHALRREYCLVSNTIESTLTGAGSMADRFTVKPNRTRNDYGELTRRAIRAIEERDVDTLRRIVESGKPRSRVLTVLGGNSVGETLIALVLPAYAHIYEKIERQYRARDLLRLVLALRQYEVAHGRLPGELAELSPAFVPKALIEKSRTLWVYDRAKRYVGVEPVPEDLSVVPHISYGLREF